MTDERKRSVATGPDEVDYLLWDTADALERLRRHNAALARQAARAGLDAVKVFEGNLQRGQDGSRAPQRTQQDHGG